MILVTKYKKIDSSTSTVFRFRFWFCYEPKKMFKSTMYIIPLLIDILLATNVESFSFVTTTTNKLKVSHHAASTPSFITFSSSCTTTTTTATSTSQLKMSDWSGFAYDDEEEELFVDFADENDSQEYKAEIGSALEAPSIMYDADPISVPQGTVLPLTEENVLGVLSACRNEIGTMFGYSAENRGVGITGGVDFVEMDGPTVVLTLKGRFWHQRTTVLQRVGAYIMGRIPEIIDVTVADPYELTDEANDEAA